MTGRWGPMRTTTAREKCFGAAMALAVMAALAFAALALLPASSQRANAQSAAPAQTAGIHVGAATCGGVVCHGSDHPRETASVLQTEYQIWSQQDHHSKAFAALSSDRARRIAGNLGVGSPQNTALCLGCHTDLVAPDRRGPKYNINDGVDCEACHGGASEWLGPHVSGLFNHEEHIAAGMYPTAEPRARAQLCLGCHFGTGDKFVSHRLIAAGHPRLAFELDTFTASEPPHFRPSTEYHQRKGEVTGVGDWVTGQAEAAHAVLRRLADPVRNHDGLLPELALFNCFDCHRPIVVGASASNALPRVNLASVAMLRIAASVVAPSLAGSLEGGASQVNGAVSGGAEVPAGAAGGLDGAVQRVESQLATFRWDQAARVALLRAFEQAARTGRLGDYLDAEQAAYGVASVLAEMTTAGAVVEARFHQPLANLYAAVGNPQAYRSDMFTNALSAVVQSVDRGDRR